MIGSKQTPAAPQPTGLTVRKQSRVLEIEFDDGAAFSLPFELLRVWSPSAEVRGHGPGQETLQTGQRNVEITAVEPVGNYAIKPVFSDGHDTGIFSWEYLHHLGTNQDALWEDYLRRLEAAGFTRESGRDAPMNKAVVSGSGCGSH
ncbi:Conserved hypothetical protein [Herminiimonas arsenicoxydans]|uniref:Gamma-butyrobetaine hydroxylase-like N-terminal domain-containing protein n=1 Tax=Herminiimonas arsenicoxydans TaxID=204773 RepID=A4G8Y4_HERAR|nr:Conserved hypothetical protein [Herminiimonas arsenicoxydans]